MTHILWRLQPILIANQRFFFGYSGREFEAFRPPSWWGTTNRSVEMPQTRCLFAIQKIFARTRWLCTKLVCGRPIRAGDFCIAASKNACVFYSSSQATGVAMLASGAMSPPEYASRRPIAAPTTFKALFQKKSAINRHRTCAECY